MFGRAGASIIAHAKAQQRMATPQYLPWEDRYLAARSKEARARPASSTTRASSTSAASTIEYGYLLEPHTDGDLYVYFPKANVLAVGRCRVAGARTRELAWFEGGWLGGRVDSLAKLLQIGNEQTRIVAATGPVISRAELKTERDALDTMFDARCPRPSARASPRKTCNAANILDGLARTWANPDQFIYDAHKGMWAHHNTLSHQIV